MGSNNKFSKDPKIKILSMKDFFEVSNFLLDAKNNLWEDKWGPIGQRVLYKFTPRFFTRIFYKTIFINFGTDTSEILHSIEVAIRDGKIEYEIFGKRVFELKEKRGKYKTSKKIDEEIKTLQESLSLIPPYEEKEVHKPKDFNQYIIDAKYITEREDLKNKYVVFDVETNGLRKKNDDLLSISIYDPTTGICYNRFLPLDLQPTVLTTWKNGINDKDVAYTSHITQEELNKVINYFKLKDKILLSYSGGEGTFDSSFIINYCQRQGIYGFEELKYENIKSMIHVPSHGIEGGMSKDYLCRLLKIKGVCAIHSGINDCILQWKLFEKLYNHPLFYIDEDLYRYNEGYIMPLTSLNNYPGLAKCANIVVPYVEGKAKLIYKNSFSQELLDKIKMFSIPRLGVSIKKWIISKLQVEEQDNHDFQAKNISKLEYIQSIGTKTKSISVDSQRDEANDYVEELYNVSKLMMDTLYVVFDIIKNDIFSSETIMSKETTISSDGKVLSICDLSSKTKILEITTCNCTLVSEDGSIDESLAQQLYYLSNGRQIFVLSFHFESPQFNFEDLINGLVKSDIYAGTVAIYQVELKVSDPKTAIRIRELSEREINILKIIESNPLIPNAEIARKTDSSTNSVGLTMIVLKKLGYICKENPRKRTSPWMLIRKLDDTTTKYIIDETEPHIIK